MNVFRLAVGSILISVLSFARAQVDCPAFDVSDLGSTNMRTPSGLVVSALAAVSGDPSNPASVQVHDSSIVCLRSGRTRDTYSGVSVVVNYTCTGPPTECTGTPILSQFDFECVAGTPTNPGVRWAAIVDGSASNIITTPPDGSLSTTLRTDCGVCISPARSIFATITNNDQHCGSCNSACNVGLMRCFNRLPSGCCNFFVNGTCVGSCTSPKVPNSNFDCVVDCGPLPSINNGMLSYNPQGQDQTLLGATVSYTCNTGYTLSGSSMRTCQADGTWSGSDPTCDIVDCGLLMNPDNGMVETPQGTTFGQEATYTCNSTYDLVGDGTRTCQADGSWSGTDPTCVTMPPPTTPPPTSPPTAPPPTTSPPIAVDCGALTNPDNGRVDTPQGTTFNQVATYTCNSGYELVGNMTRTCQADGTWSESEPICDATDLNSGLCDAAIMVLVIAVSLTSIFIVV